MESGAGEEVEEEGWMGGEPVCRMREEPAGGGDHGGRGIRVVTVRV